EGVTVTADPATNALVIQASKEAYETLRLVIEQLDISRPQVLVEALIVEVDVTDDLNLGFDVAFRLINGDMDLLLSTGSFLIPGGPAGAGLLGSAVRAAAGAGETTSPFDQTSATPDNGSNLGLGIQASKVNSNVNIVSAPHILTSDNEEAEIRIGNNIPIVTGRTDAATGSSTGLASSVNVERQDIGITLRVTPQISEGNTVRLQIFQELTEVTASQAGSVDAVGVTLSSRKVENTVVVNDGETVVIGGLISETFTDTVTGVPYLKDIPYLGWLFKQKGESLRKINLLIFLTPHIIRSAEDLEQQTIRKRLELEDSVGDPEEFPELANYERNSASAGFSVAQELANHSARYPLERMRELEEDRADQQQRWLQEVEKKAEAEAQRYAVEVATFLDEAEATKTLTTLLDAGYEGILVSSESSGQVFFKVEIGPFDDLWEAQRAAGSLDTAYGYRSSVTAVRQGPR
ncbi:MAG: secretin N-terminal domain-containing protein, partial [Myxococcota bacterium]